MSSAQRIYVWNLHVAIAVIGKARTACLVYNFRSRSTRSQRTNERTTKLTVSQSGLPHPPTFQLLGPRVETRTPKTHAKIVRNAGLARFATSHCP
jgi:hypothetical protein